MVEEEINYEFAVIFNRYKTEDDNAEVFVPISVAEGNYNEEDKCFVDADQNVYHHICSNTKVGNVFAYRLDIMGLVSQFKDTSINKFKEQILLNMAKSDYVKLLSEGNGEFCPVQVHNSQNDETKLLDDYDTQVYLESLATKTKTKHIRVRLKNSLTPAVIADKLKKHVKGQDEAIKEIATLIWAKYNMPKIKKTNLFVIGPSSVGKTSLARAIKEDLNYPVSIYPLSNSTNGIDMLYEMLAKAYYDNGEDLEKTKNSIIIIDNLEKICSQKNNDSYENIAFQEELLHIINGCEASIVLENQAPLVLDTSNITFICCGNIFGDKFTEGVAGFAPERHNDEDIKKKLKAAGIISDLINSQMKFIEFADINKDKTIIKEIILDTEDGILDQMSKSFAPYGITIDDFNASLDKIIDKAIKENLSIQNITNIITNTLLKVIEKIGNNPGRYHKLIIGSNIIDNPEDFRLIPKQFKTRKKIKDRPRPR